MNEKRKTREAFEELIDWCHNLNMRVNELESKASRLIGEVSDHDCRIDDAQRKIDSVESDVFRFSFLVKSVKK